MTEVPLAVDRQELSPRLPVRLHLGSLFKTDHLLEQGIADGAFHRAWEMHFKVPAGPASFRGSFRARKARFADGSRP
jgi:hypothetical protein